jgi:hypothetical protein
MWKFGSASHGNAGSVDFSLPPDDILEPQLQDNVIGYSSKLAELVKRQDSILGNDGELAGGRLQSGQPVNLANLPASRVHNRYEVTQEDDETALSKLDEQERRHVNAFQKLMASRLAEQTGYKRVLREADEADTGYKSALREADEAYPPPLQSRKRYLPRASVEYLSYDAAMKEYMSEAAVAAREARAARDMLRSLEDSFLSGRKTADEHMSLALNKSTAALVSEGLPTQSRGRVPAPVHVLSQSLASAGMKAEIEDSAASAVSGLSKIFQAPLLVLVGVAFMASSIVVCFAGKVAHRFDAAKLEAGKVPSDREANRMHPSMHKLRPTTEAGHFAKASKRAAHFASDELCKSLNQAGISNTISELPSGGATKPRLKVVDVISTDDLDESAEIADAPHAEAAVTFALKALEVHADADTSAPSVVTPWGEPLDASRYLCSGLVVPRASECVLLVPMLQRPSAILGIRDSSGREVLQAAVTFPDWMSGAEQYPAITLYACHSAKKCLGYCRIQRRTALKGQCCAHIHREDGKLFGSLSKQSKSDADYAYLLSCGQDGIRLYFEGDFKKFTVNIWSGDQDLFGGSSPGCNAPFDPAGRYWELRVLANMDASLVLAALLCIQLVESPALATFPEPFLSQK